MRGHAQPQAADPVTVARRRHLSGASVAAVTPVQPPPFEAPPTTGVPVPLADEPAPEAFNPVGHFRRCTFRRVDRVAPRPGRGELPDYEVMCLYVDQDAPLSLGDLTSARATCEACAATGIFRPDAD